MSNNRRTALRMNLAASLITIIISVIACSETMPQQTTLPEKTDERAVQATDQETTRPQTNPPRQESEIARRPTEVTAEPTEGVQPIWGKFFAEDPRVHSYRWYQGGQCPTGDYSHRDDLYIFDSEDALSPLEVQARDLEDKVIGTKGFHSTAGHICLAQSEEIHPSRRVALHELAHAVAYTSHGLTGHSEIHSTILAEMAIRFDRSGCKTKDPDLMTLIDWSGGRRVFGPPLPVTDGERAMAQWCAGGQATTPATVATPMQVTPAPPTPTASPTPDPKDRFLRIPYDATTVLTNRRPPPGYNCVRDHWTKSLSIENPQGRIQDARNEWAAVQQLHFGYCPGRDEGYSAWATITNLSSDKTPDLHGYVAEWRTAEGHLIGRATISVTNPGSEDKRISAEISLPSHKRPWDLTELPGIFLLYDAHTAGAQPTPTPPPEANPAKLTLKISVDTSDWERGAYRSREESYLRRQLAQWSEQDLESGDLTGKDLTLIDANNTEWTVTGIVITERNSSIKSYDTDLFQIKLENRTRALADFTGYQVLAFTTAGDLAGRGEWSKPENHSGVWIAQTQFKGWMDTADTKPATLIIWDPHRIAEQPVPAR